jgi:hypothetical protein
MVRGMVKLMVKLMVKVMVKVMGKGATKVAVVSPTCHYFFANAVQASP